MPYAELIGRSFKIAWRHRYLWLLGLLAGESAGASAGGRFGAGPFTTTRASDRSGAALNHFVAANLSLIAGVAIGIVVLSLVLFFVSCAATPALIRTSAELDADRPWSHGSAWRAGWQRFGPILRLKLLLFLYVVLVVALVGGLLALTVLAFATRQNGTGLLLLLTEIALLLVMIPLTVVVGIGYVLALRVVTLELTGAIAGFRRGLGLLRRSPGRVVVVWLLAIGLALVAGTLAGAVLTLILSVPGSIATAAILAGDLATAGPALVVTVLLALVVGGVIGGATGAYLSTYWTLAFRRLDWPGGP